MKQLNHIFLRYNKDVIKTFGTDSYTEGNYISGTDICRHCGKFAQEIYDQVNIEIIGTSAYEQSKWLNEHTKCITEEEFIIKNIIE